MTKQKAPLPKQISFLDPLELTLRAAYDKYHRRVSHKASYVQAANTALTHWERCTTNPPIGEVTNATMNEFAGAFLRNPLPSKVAILLRRSKKGDKGALATLKAIGITKDRFIRLDQEQAYQAICTARTIPVELLPMTPTFNAQVRTLEAIFATLGPKHRGNRYAIGLMKEVPCCRMEEEDEPEVVTAFEDDLNAIYQHCDAAAWPAREKTGVPPPELWRALFVYLYNAASRRGDWINIEKTQVKLDQGVILRRQGKSGKFRAVPINDTVVRHLRPLMDSHGPLLFPFPSNKRDIYSTWYRIQAAAGIKVDRHGPRFRQPYYGFHEIRKTSLSEYFDLSEQAAQDMGAHSDLATTLKHYVHATKKEGKLRRAVEALPQPAAFCLSEDAPPSAPVPTPPDRPRLRIVG